MQALQTDGTVLGDKALVVVSPLASVPTPAPITPVMALQMQQIQQSQMAVLQQQQLAAQVSKQDSRHGRWTCVYLGLMVLYMHRTVAKASVLEIATSCGVRSKLSGREFFDLCWSSARISLRAQCDYHNCKITSHDIAEWGCCDQTLISSKRQE